jgi:hypothetical protein
VWPTDMLIQYGMAYGHGDTVWPTDMLIHRGLRTC